MSILLPLLTAHLLGDFVFQTDRIVARKRQPAILMGHGAVHAVATYLLIGVPVGWMVPLAVFSTHVVIDFIKASARTARLRGFILDQIAHVVALTLIAVTYSTLFGAPDSLWDRWPLYERILLLTAGVVAVVRTGAFLVEFAVEPFLAQIELDTERIRGLREGGRTIGQLERALIFVFVFVNQFTAIGFLIAAKSIFRFGELKERANRMEAEYIIIGTLISFLWAIVLALLTRYLFDL